MSNLYSTATMMKVIELLNRPSSFLLNTYFPSIQQSDTETLNFDVITGSQRLAPFVSPMVAGKIVQEEGLTTTTFKPAYIKVKTPLLSSGALKRRVGEKIGGGGISPMERQMKRMGSTILRQVTMVQRRKEVMAAEVLRTGSCVIEGDEYPTQVMNFGRDPDLTQTLLASARWGEAGVKPLDDIQDWALLLLKKSGAQPTVITMDVESWRLFIASAEVKSQLDTRNINANSTENKIHTATGGIFQGVIGGLSFYTYADFYLDDDDVLQPVLPNYTVLMGGEGIEGVQAHGAILDDGAAFNPFEFFTKSWMEPDPAIRYVMTQSAPLIVPCNPNASFCATVR